MPHYLKSHVVAQMSLDHSTDEVKFGEVAMEPPSLSAKPRKAIETDEKLRVSEQKFSNIK